MGCGGGAMTNDARDAAFETQLQDGGPDGKGRFTLAHARVWFNAGWQLATEHADTERAEHEYDQYESSFKERNING